MPVLPAETSLYPSELFEPPAGHLEDRCWRVLHTKPRQEKSLARRLVRSGIPFYLPLISRRLLMRGRIAESYVPLFSGYVFLLGTREERLKALSTGCVVHSLEVFDQEQMWRDLRQVRQLLASGAPVLPEQRLAPGMLVEIQRGSLMGLRGRILRVASGHRFVVQVDFIQQGASILLEDVALSAVDAATCQHQTSRRRLHSAAI
jgi:transcriptional antiterminator RfaH